jgi:hypothetical protein
MIFTATSKLALPEEMAESYILEKANWTRGRAYSLVKQSEIPAKANVRSSHVIYKWKTDGTRKAQIVPNGHRDNEKEFLRTDASIMSVEALRLIASILEKNGG